MTQIFLKSTCDGLSNDILIIFFGYVVAKNFIIKDCVPTLKYYWNLIKVCENSIFHYFFIDLNAPASKIQISLNMSPNFMTKILLKSTYDGLSNDILIIFFEHMLKDISLVKDGMLIVIRSIMITFSTFCASQIDFSRFWRLFSNPIIFITTYWTEMIESALDRWDVRLSYAYKNIGWKSTDPSGNTLYRRISRDRGGQIAQTWIILV